MRTPEVGNSAQTAQQIRETIDRTKKTLENIDYTEEHAHAAAAVANGEWDAAFLLNPTPVEQVIAVAGANDRMPRKSTFFYPKLGTGIVLYAME